MDKCRYILYCCPTLKLVTDHQPLVGIFRKELHEIPNRRLQRLREKVTDYQFDVEWVEGKTHYIVDALSRHPIGEPFSEQAFGLAAVLHSLDPSLTPLCNAAIDCPAYQRLLNAVKTMDKTQLKNLPDSDPIAPYKSVWDELSVHHQGQLVLYQTDRIVVPASERPRLLDLLHRGHSGIGKTRQLGRQLYYWPGLSNDIKNMVQNCSACSTHLPSQLKQPLQITVAEEPLEQTSCDLFSYAGMDYLVWVDRYSGMLWCERLTGTTTEKVTKALERWFRDFGFPRVIRTDGGPQFRGPFDQWCEDLHIIHELSSPYNPRSNGHAEAGVKVAKTILEKCDANMRQFFDHLSAWRNTCLLYTSPSPRDRG